jgi:hypothetical protein
MQHAATGLAFGPKGLTSSLVTFHKYRSRSRWRRASLLPKFTGLTMAQMSAPVSSCTGQAALLGLPSKSQLGKSIESYNLPDSLVHHDHDDNKVDQGIAVWKVSAKVGFVTVTLYCTQYDRVKLIYYPHVCIFLTATFFPLSLFSRLDHGALTTMHRMAESNPAASPLVKIGATFSLQRTGYDRSRGS